VFNAGGLFHVVGHTFDLACPPTHPPMHRPTRPFAQAVHKHPAKMASTLRTLLDARQSEVFGAVADVVIDTGSIDNRLAAMHRALVAHDALCAYLASVDVPMPIVTLIDAIKKATELGLITEREKRWLQYFNFEANRAKHRGLPF
jgi:hypothetical protein